MKAGFASYKITPPLGTRMTGWVERDRARGCDAVHDDLYARALYLNDHGEEALILGFDLLFFSREEADRYKGAIGRAMGLSPWQILLNTSHTHAGPKVGSWAYNPPADPYYLQSLEQAIVMVAARARGTAVEATLWAGITRSELPMSRRLVGEGGEIEFRPNPTGITCNALPVCLLRTADGEPLCLLFSASCHPSTIGGYAISADYPGVAMRLLDAYLGRPASLFLQGTGGDAKASIIGRGLTHWRKGTWEDVIEAGTIVADAVTRCLEAGLTRVEPSLQAASLEMHWPMQPNVGLAGYQARLADPQSDLNTRLWAEDMIAQLLQGYALPTAVPITLHGIKLGQGLRLVGLEGEAVAEWGLRILEHYGQGVTFPLGYTDGAQLYLPTSRMLDEGGYEATSYHEYRQPAPLAKGMEALLQAGLTQLQAQGID